MKVIANRSERYPKTTAGKEYEVLKMYDTKSGSTVCWSKCNMIQIKDDNGEILNQYTYAFESNPIYDKITRGDQLLNVITGELRTATKYLGEYILVFDGKSQSELAWHPADIKNLTTQKEETSITPSPKPDMTTSKLSQLIANDYLTPEKQKEITDAAKSLKKEMDELTKKRDDATEMLFSLQEKYNRLEDAYGNNDNEGIELALKNIKK